MNLEAINQIVAGLSIIASGIHQVSRFSKKMGAVEARLEALEGIYDAYQELNEQQEAMRIRQEFLWNEIQKLQKYN